MGFLLRAPTLLSVEQELEAERAHLDHARSCLRAMRERAMQLGDVGVDAFASESLGKMLAQRVKALHDDGTTPLFFGRLDYAVADATGLGESFHIGRRHVVDTRGEPVVIDWRAPISLPFYRATARDPMGVELRRRFGYQTGRITSLEDERLLVGGELGTDSRILTEEIERPRIGPMRDIVATIQPDQDEIVRADLAETICVQGAPGTGKTAVGLHRAAYLLYTYRERLRRGGVLVIGPNRAFLSYIGEVLPALGEVDVTQITVDELPGRVRVRGVDSAAVARLKGDARMAAVIRKAVFAGVRRPDESVVVPFGSRRWRITSDDVRGMVRDVLAGKARYGVARERLHVFLAETVRRQMEEAGDAPDDRLVARLAGSAPVREAVGAVWPEVDPVGLVFRLLSDADFLAASARGVLDEDEQRLLLWEVAPKSRGSVRWTLADAFLIDEAADIVTRTPSVDHVILDEAQDLSPMQFRAVGRRCSTGSLTVLGDLAQGTTPWSASSWVESLAHLGKPDGRVELLTKGYRVPREVLDFANRLLPAIAAGVPPASSVRRSPGSLVVLPTTDLVASLVEAVRDATAVEGSVAVVVADEGLPALLERLLAAGVAAERLEAGEIPVGTVSVVPASLAKGLEYDTVIVVEPADIVDAEGSRGLRRLYVVLTRAVSRLTIVHARDLPAALVA